MLTLLIAAAVYAGFRACRAALASLQGLPQRQEDMIFY